MTTISIDIPNNITPRVIDALCKRFHYNPLLENGDPNPETKAQFVKRKLIEYIKQAVREQEIEDARNIAATQAGQAVDSQIIIT